MFPLVAGILVAADIPPGPAIESALLHVSDVVGHKIVSQAIAFVDRAPELVGFRIDGKSTAGIANSVGVNCGRIII